MSLSWLKHLGRTQQPNPSPALASPRNYIIVTGYYDSAMHGGAGPYETFDKVNGRQVKGGGLTFSDFYQVWVRNTLRYARPDQIYVINAGAKPIASEHGHPAWIDLTCNIGSSFSRVVGLDKRIGGWSLGFTLGCLLAFGCNADLIFKEQDCLAFGNWVERLYSDAETHRADLVVGKRGPHGCATALMLVRRNFALDVVHTYLGFKPSERELIAEQKFARMLSQFDNVVETSMGYDRERPVGWNDEAFYLQQLSADDYAEVVRRQL